MNPKLCAALTLLVSSLASYAQTAGESNEGSRVTYDQTNHVATFSWWGRAGATYFVKLSSDLMTWTYLNVSVAGLGDVASINHPVLAPRFFYRLHFITAPYSTDFDGDGILNLEEIQAGLDPLRAPADSNGDGLLDQISQRLGMDPLASDTDNDGLTNSQEALLGTNPLHADSDDDGALDEVDAFPLDPAHSQMPAPSSTDQTAPSIALSRPLGATLLP